MSTLGIPWLSSRLSASSRAMFFFDLHQEIAAVFDDDIIDIIDKDVRPEAQPGFDFVAAAGNAFAVSDIGVGAIALAADQRVLERAGAAQTQ